MVTFCVCLDGSEKAHKAFLRAVSLYKDGDTLLMLVVVDLVHYMMSNPKASELLSITNIKEEMIENGKSLIEKYENLSKEYFITKYESIHAEGTPKEVIVETVQKKYVDVLLLGTVGLLNKELISMGSTAQYCVILSEMNNNKITHKDLLYSENIINNRESPFIINTNSNEKPTYNKYQEVKIPTTKPDFSKFPQSSVLGRVKDFLPKIKQANADLQKRIENNEDVNIENVKDGEQYIELKLALGILEKKEGLSQENIIIPNNNNNNNNNNSIKFKKDEEQSSFSKEDFDNEMIIDKNRQQMEQEQILQLLKQPTSILDKFITEDSDDEENSDYGNQEELEPTEYQE
ncbi:hypothetical protein DLAC_02508 [Tieghemostelium lacteum]|uniref:UspA domain-containing protein n=1 Tax=Tieghemostelium lacteum TaxID=361077 RepID=A0A152A2R5_TIELA|nr:hypothetical protein DLAC_02508 [Tieghemostelium lacteum]|eukprot:KYR00500.1 hypothetical protein DLAC_02508 [Tieghemostelium lacteum]